jgi:hypothetical protein
MATRRGRIAAISCVLAGLACAWAAFAAGERRAPVFLWCATGSHAERVNLSATPLRPTAVVFYEHQLGLIPRFWKGEAERGGVPQAADLAAHAKKVRADVEARIPDPRFVGYGIIDLESWGPLWEFAGKEYHDLSIALVRRQSPGRTPEQVERLARAAYDLAARRLLEETLRVCKEMRPLVRWGFYGWPYRGYEAHTARLTWLFESVNAIYPECYTVWKAKPGGGHGDGHADPSEYTTDTRGKMDLATRLAPGKPVLVLVWARYHEINGFFGGRFLEEADLEAMVRTPLEAGADGLIFWDSIVSEEVAREYGPYLETRLGPALRAAANRTGSGRTP